MHLPQGYRLERPERSLVEADERGGFVLLLVGIFALVFLAVAAVLESWYLAGLAVACIPLAWIGVAAGFLWSGESFGEPAWLGMALVIGAAVNVSLLITARLHQLLQAHRGTPVPLLALIAASDRLPAVGATAFTTVVAIFPLCVLPGVASSWKGFAVTAVGGIISMVSFAPAAIVALVSLAAASTSRRLPPSMRLNKR